jgi:hypothetical protein
MLLAQGLGQWHICPILSPTPPPATRVTLHAVWPAIPPTQMASKTRVLFLCHPLAIANLLIE